MFHRWSSGGGSEYTTGNSSNQECGSAANCLQGRTDLWLGTLLALGLKQKLGMAKKQDELKRSFKQPAPFSSQIQQCRN
jgi:hypothetical protein